VFPPFFPLFPRDEGNWESSAWKLQQTEPVFTPLPRRFFLASGEKARMKSPEVLLNRELPPLHLAEVKVDRDAFEFLLIPQTVARLVLIRYVNCCK
jgi:hypothetical protein